MDFEVERIQELKNERQYIQQKTFTKWINSFLQKYDDEITNIFTDLSDGKRLMRLLEIISGEKLGRPNRGKLRVQKIENVNRCLAFLLTKVKLESIGAEDIVDGNERLILGLIWTIILRFQIQEIEVDVEDGVERVDELKGEKKSARDALLLWVQRRLRGYKHCEIRDFSSSWRSGMGFSALMHSQNESHIDYKNLDANDHYYNLKLAFDVASKEYGIAKLLDPEDVDTTRPDDRSIMTYVSSIYHVFSKLDKGNKSVKRIHNIVAKIKTDEEKERQLNKQLSGFLDWILSKTAEMKKRDFPNSLDSTLLLLRQFQHYVTEEKVVKYREKSDLQLRYFELKLSQTGTRANEKNSKLITDINTAWDELEREENARNIELRKEILRQEKLMSIAENFMRKATIRENYIDEMYTILSDPKYASNIEQIQPVLKKHEAIKADIESRFERVTHLEKISGQLKTENYCEYPVIEDKMEEIRAKWARLADLLTAHDVKITSAFTLAAVMEELVIVEETIDDISLNQLQKIDSEELTLDRMYPFVTEINTLATRFERIQTRAKTVQDIESYPKYAKRVKSIQKKLDTKFAELEKFKTLLQNQQMFLKIRGELEEIHAWMHEKFHTCAAYSNIAINYSTLNRLQERQNILVYEIPIYEEKFNSLLSMLDSSTDGGSQKLQEKIGVMKTEWVSLKKIVDDRSKDIALLQEMLLLSNETNELSSSLKSLLILVKVNELGNDLDTCKALINRLNHSKKSGETLSKEITVQGDRVGAFMEDHGNKLLDKEAVLQEREIPQVQALFSYKNDAKSFSVKKREVMFLVAKSNDDWWSVRTEDGQNGFVPRNYVKEIEPRKITIKTDHSFVVEALAQSNLNDRQEALSEGSAVLKEIVAQKEKNLHSQLAFLQFLDEYNVIVEWIQKMENLDTYHPSDERKIQELDQKIKGICSEETLKGISMDDQKRTATQKMNTLQKLWVELINQRNKSVQKSTERVEDDKVIKEYEEIKFWIQSKMSDIQVMRSNAESNIKYTITQSHLLSLEKEIRAILKRIDDFVAEFSDRKQVKSKARELKSDSNDLLSAFNEFRTLMEELLANNQSQSLCTSYLAWSRKLTEELANVNASGTIKEKGHFLDLANEDKLAQDQKLIALKGFKDPQVREVLEEQKRVTEMLEAYETELYNEESDLKNRKEEAALLLLADQLITRCKSMKPEDMSAQEEIDISTKTDNLEVRKEKLFENLPRTTESDRIRSSLTDKWEMLLDERENLKKHWNDYQAFDEFRLTAYDLVGFMDTKKAIVDDLSFRSKLNLKTKLKRHQDHASEIRGRASQVKLLNLVGNKLIKRDRFSYSDETMELLESVNKQWDDLLDQTAQKSQHLEQSVETLAIQSTLSNLESSLKERAPIPVQSYPFARHELIPQREKCATAKLHFSEVRRTIQVLQSKLTTFEGDETESYRATLERIIRELENSEALNEKNLLILKDLGAYFDINRGIEIDIGMLKEKEQEVDTILNNDIKNSARLSQLCKELPNDLQNQRAKLKRAEDDMKQYQDLEDQHRIFAANKKELNEVINSVEKKAQILLELVNKSENFSVFSSDIQGVEDWIQDKIQLLSSSPYGTDERSALQLLKKLKDVELEKECYNNIKKEISSSAGSKEFSQPAEVRSMVENLDKGMGRLDDLIKERRALLMQSVQYYEFHREVEEAIEMMEKKKNAIQWMMSNTEANTADALRDVKAKIDGEKEALPILQSICKNCDELHGRLLGLQNSMNPMEQRERDELLDTVHATYEDLEACLNAASEKIDQLFSVADAKERLANIVEDTRENMLRVNSEKITPQRDVMTLGSDLNDVKQNVKLLEERIIQIKAQNVSQLSRDVDVADHCQSELKREISRYEHSLGELVTLKTLTKELQGLLLWSQAAIANLPDIKDDVTLQQGHIIRFELDNQRLEIENKESQYSKLIEQSKGLKTNGAMRDQMESLLQNVLDHREMLHGRWQERKIKIDQIIDYNFFLQDFERINSLYKKKAARVTQIMEGKENPNEDDIDDQLKEVEMTGNQLKNVYSSHKEFEDQANKLLSQSHMKRSTITQLIQSLQNQRKTTEKVWSQALEELKRRKQLASLLSEIEFNDAWISEKQSWCDDLDKRLREADARDKMLLSAQMTLQFNEVMNRKPNIESAIERAQKIDDNAIRREGRALEEKWSKLQKTCSDLETEWHDLRAENVIKQKLVQIQTWLTEKDPTVKSNETFASKNACENELSRINKIGEELISQQHVTDNLCEEFRNFLAKPEQSKTKREVSDCQNLFKDFARCLAMRKKSLEENMGYLDDKDLLKESIEGAEKCEKVLASCDFSQPLELNLSAQKNQLGKAQENMTSLKNTRDSVARKGYTNREWAGDVDDLRVEFQNKLGSADDQYANKSKELKRANEIVEFHSQIKTYLKEITLLRQKLADFRSGALASKDTPVEDKLNFAKSIEDTVKLIPVKNLLGEVKKWNYDPITESYVKLEDEVNQTLDECSSYQQLLNGEKKRFYFLKRLANIQSWTNQAQSHLELQLIGKTLTETRGHKQRLQELERKFEESQSILHQLQNEATEDQMEAVNEVSDSLKVVRSKMTLSAEHLNLAEACHILLQKISISTAFIAKKWKYSIEESYLNPTHMSEKLNEHETQENLVLDHEPFIGAIDAEANKLIGESQVENHLLTEVGKQRDFLLTEWQQLKSQMELKKGYLDQANIVSTTDSMLDDFNLWLTKVIALIEMDSGQTKSQVRQLLSQYKSVDSQREEKTRLLEELKVTVKQEVERENFLAKQLSTKLTDISERFGEFSLRHRNNMDKLGDNLEFLDYQTESKKVLFWLSDKRAQLLTDKDGIDGLHQLQIAMKKAALIDKELAKESNEPKRVIKSGEAFIQERKHFKPEVTSLLEELSEKTNELTQLTKEKQSILEAELFVCYFMLDCSELQSLLNNELNTIAQNNDIQDDLVETFLQTIVKMGEDLKEHEVTLKDLQTRSSQPEFAKSKSKNAASKKLTEVDMTLTKTTQEVNTIEEKLSKRLRLIHFRQRCDEILIEIDLQKVAVSSEDVGRTTDFGAAFVKFEELLKKNKSIGDMIESLRQSDEFSLNYQLHARETGKVMKDIDNGYGQLLEMTEAKRKTLEAAKSIFLFTSQAESLNRQMTEALQQLGEDTEELADEEEIQITSATIEGINLIQFREKLEELSNVSHKLHKDVPESRGFIAPHLTKLSALYSTLAARLETKRANLSRDVEHVAILSRYGQWMTWITEMLTTITSNKLATSVSDGIFLIERHSEFKEVIAKREKDLESFLTESRRSLGRKSDQGSRSILTKLQALEERKRTLDDVWEKRLVLYKKHLDYLGWIQELTEVEKWLNDNDSAVTFDHRSPPQSLEEANDAIEKHDFVFMSMGQINSKVDKLCKVTQLEAHLQSLREAEQHASRVEQERLIKEEKETFKRKETVRRTREEKRSNERRRTQEIVFMESTKTHGAREQNGSSHEPIILKANMEKKHTLEDGGKRSTVRAWKNVFAVLRSETLTFFSSGDDFEARRSPVLTLLLKEISIQAFAVYAKKRFVFALCTERGGEHLLQCGTEADFAEWSHHLSINAKSFISDEDNSRIIPKEKKNSMINKLLSRK